MEYSIFTSVDYMLEAFESIDRIDVILQEIIRLRRFILIIDIVIMILQ